MFERYTETARRVLLSARDEATKFGSPYIETEHLLLGLLREDKGLANRLFGSDVAVESIRKEIEDRAASRRKVPPSVDLPLSQECKRVFAYAAEEAARRSHNHIGAEHLLLGLLREDKCLAAEILRKHAGPGQAFSVVALEAAEAQAAAARREARRREWSADSGRSHMLSAPEIRKFYNRIGKLQDSQAFYEDRAIGELIAHANFGEVRSLFEFGCGTGRVAEALLRSHLPADSHYCGVDVSETMARLARQRLQPWRDRAEVILTDGSLRLPAATRSCDFFLSTYVFDLLSDDAIRKILAEARRILAPGGRVGLASLTHGVTRIGRWISGLWSRVHSSWPKLVGGCRPVDLLQYFPQDQWKIQHLGVVTHFAVASGVVVAAPLQP